MRETPVVAGEHGGAEEGKRARIDLSVPQVAGSAVAAVLGAQLASSFGVYGTIIGAGVVSIVATCGGTIFQHFFTRTGEQLRVAPAAPGRPAGERPARTPGGFTEGTVHRGRARGVRWGRKRTVAATALVFGVTMAGITTYELASGQSLSGAPDTTVGNAFTGESASGSGDSDGSGGSGEQDSDTSDTSGGSGTADDSDTSEDSGVSGVSGEDGRTPAPSVTPQDGGTATGSGRETPAGGDAPPATPDGTGGQDSGDTASPEPDASATSPGPSADSRSGTDVPGQDGPAAP
ncbi:MULTISPECIES: hypothetical protein [unclassified Streptomyces]|uniref:hypothetical protein n=1 Tax=unclassified Streptomyces TaxID=2593676 RepID=UPI00073CE91C|nr:hypothetical protein [Streptomyces sp. AVP053U2]ODA71392.1 hypothetical protein APS67_004359 [Streptomyces sp. AVP053U2]